MMYDGANAAAGAERPDSFSDERHNRHRLHRRPLVVRGNREPLKYVCWAFIPD